MVNSVKFNPFDEYLSGKFLLKIPFGKFAWAVASLPFFSFIFCVIHSILYNFEKATSSHCHVFNFLPSVSSVIGNFSPQKNIWQFAIALHALPRFYVAYCYLLYHQDVLKSSTSYMNILVFFFNTVEITALVILSFWTSSDNYGVHKISFIIFILMSEFYMIFIWILHKNFRNSQRSFTEIKSLKLKKRLLIINIFCILLSTYFFIRHNLYCEPYIYSAFAFF